MPGYDDIMGNPFGIGGSRKRKRLQPGQRMSDGTVYHPPGSNDARIAQIEELKKKRDALDEQIAAIEATLVPVEPDSSKESEPEVPEATEEATEVAEEVKEVKPPAKGRGRKKTTTTKKATE